MHLHIGHSMSALVRLAIPGQKLLSVLLTQSSLPNLPQTIYLMKNFKVLKIFRGQGMQLRVQVDVNQLSFQINIFFLELFCKRVYEAWVVFFLCVSYSKIDPIFFNYQIKGSISYLTKMFLFQGREHQQPFFSLPLSSLTSIQIDNISLPRKSSLLSIHFLCSC